MCLILLSRCTPPPPQTRSSIQIPLFFDQMFKYRARPPPYDHILLTTPKKHPRLASYQLWSHSEPTQARISRKTTKITFFLRVTHYFAVLPGPQLTSYESITFLRQHYFKPFTHRILLKILFIRSCNEKTRFRELRKLIFRFFCFSQGRCPLAQTSFF